MMSLKIDELYEEFNPDILLDVFEDYLVGKIKFSYQFNFVHISSALRDKGVKTKRELEAKKAMTDFYSFQSESYKHNNQK